MILGEFGVCAAQSDCTVQLSFLRFVVCPGILCAVRHFQWFWLGVENQPCCLTGEVLEWDHV